MKKKSDPGALSHVDAAGKVRMVDVTAKAATVREATAGGEIRMSAAAIRAIRDGAVAKGDPLQAARIAGIMAAKRTADLIPLCHPLALTSVEVTLQSRRWGYVITATVRTTGPTGVEMEALTAVSVAALTVYDMLKAVDRTMEIGAVRLLAKSGGRSGTFRC
jgi:cyclic pyranopterin phosphate synthase